MAYAWIDTVQQEIDGSGVVNYLNDQGVYDVWTSYESCLCQITLEGVETGEEVFATIAAPGMLTNAGYQAFLIYDAGGFFAVENLSDGIVSIEDGFLSIDFGAYGSVYLTDTECAFLLTSDNSTKITALQAVRITPAGAVLTFDFPTPAIKLSTPTGLYADNITSDSARTNWQAVDNASNYKVQYKAAGDTVWTETYTD